LLSEERSLRHFERVLYLKKLRTIGSLPTAQLAIVAEYLKERFFRRGSVLLREGEPIRAIYFVVDGKVHLRRKGRDLGHAHSGAGVGGLGLLAQHEEGIEAIAESDTFTLELDSEAVREVLEDHFGILHHLIKDTCAQLIRHAAAARRPFVVPPRPRLPALPAGRELDLVERIFILRQVVPFANSSIDALAELSRGLVEVRFAAGTSLWRRGDLAEALFLLVSGTVACTPAEPARPFVLGPGIPVGAIEAVAEQPRWYDAVTESEVVALSGDVEGLIDAFEDHFGLAMGYLATMSQWLLLGLEADKLSREKTLREFYGCDQDALEAAHADGGGATGMSHE
jgi:CRP-like cAMP-binding protein